jgi:hypothetical protein
VAVVAEVSQVAVGAAEVSLVAEVEVPMVYSVAWMDLAEAVVRLLPPWL